MAGAAMDAEDTGGQQGFARAVAAVRAGASVDEQARWLYSELTDEERLWILDGDTPFWSGLADMMSGGFNEHTFVQEPLALWSDDARIRVPADRATVSVQVGAHAQDPHALAVDLAPAPLSR